MTKKMILPILPFLLPSLFTMALANESEGKKETKGEEYESKMRRRNEHLILENESFYPRYLKFPSIKLEDPTKQASYDFTQHRANLLLIVASWNQHSREVLAQAQEQLLTLHQRGIGVYAIASHDNESDLAKVRQQLGLRFPLELASLAYIEAIKNPKLPTLWLLNHQSIVMNRKEMPTISEMLSFYTDLKNWYAF